MSAMFAVIVAGRPVLIVFHVSELKNLDAVNHVVVFLTGQMQFPGGVAGGGKVNVNLRCCLSNYRVTSSKLNGCLEALIMKKPLYYYYPHTESNVLNCLFNLILLRCVADC
ncbi:unnamed protein product [Soboliphyme baturini]|uniref:DUF775 domain-containing protein n=1 Tax=Soboliphyme baturini TaxID=241478 RepID=A0A183J5E9_9BILA|nr:unnamed protein product [Soboliphyme baturini]